MSKEKRTDTVLTFLINFNETNGIWYNGVLYPKGTLKMLLDSATKPIEKGLIDE